MNSEKVHNQDFVARSAGAGGTPDYKYLLD